MRNNYKRLGDYIELVDQRNEDLAIDILLGLSISKEFIPSVANTIGTNMKRYKIVEKNQFACSIMQVRRDGKMPVAILKSHDKAIISQAYPVFKVTDESVLNPDYLMMWFKRKEFDREATFHAVGGVRGSLEWEDFMNFKLPVPSIEKQRDIVAEYNAVDNRIRINEQLNQKLEETVQAIYKHWFVDFEFPNKNGQPYKSSGGAMVYNHELDKEIPEGWEVGLLSELVEVINGYAFKSNDFIEEGDFPIIKIKNITPPTVSLNDCFFYKKKLNERFDKIKIKKGDILISMTGSGANQMKSAVGQVGRFYHNRTALLNQRVGKLQMLKEEYGEYVYQFIKNEDTHLELLNGSTGSANQANISPTQIKSLKIFLPGDEILKKFHEKVKMIDRAKRNESQSDLKKLKDLLLSKMSKVEVEKEMVN